MKSLVSIQDSFRNKISFYHIVLFLAALPFDQFYSQLILASFTLHTFIHATKKDFSQLFRKELIILSSVFLITVACTPYTINKQEAFSLWSRQLAILIFPILLFLNPLDLKKYARQILILFALVCAATTLYLFIDAFRVIFYYHLPMSAVLSPLFMNHHFSEPIGIHATYFSLYIFIGLNSAVYYGFTGKKKMTKVLLAIAAAILLVGLVQLGSRAALIAQLVIVFFVIPFILLKRKRLLYLIFSGFVTASIALVIINIDSFRERFINNLKEDLTEETAGGSITDSRLKRWEAAFELVKQSPVIGYGSGDETDILKEQYFKHKLYDAYLNKLNAHNQFLSFLLMAGIIGLAAYLLTLLYGLRLAIKTKNMMFTCFLILLFVVSMSENILARNKGIFFYAFFFSFFVSIATKRKIVASPHVNEDAATAEAHLTF